MAAKDHLCRRLSAATEKHLDSLTKIGKHSPVSAPWQLKKQSPEEITEVRSATLTKLRRGLTTAKNHPKRLPAVARLSVVKLQKNMSWDGEMRIGMLSAF